VATDRAGVALALLAPWTAFAQAEHGGTPEHDTAAPLHEMRWGYESLTLVDELELAPMAPGAPVSLEAIGWYGGDKDRLWTRLEGEQATNAADGELEVHAMYGRLVTPWWDAVGGLRLQGQRKDGSGDLRGHVVLGVIGLAPLRFEVEPELFVSFDGDVSGRFRASYQFLLTQRWIVEPEAEVNAAVQEVARWGTGGGLNDVSAALRMRYELRRELGPYIGARWLARAGRTAELAQASGQPATEASLVAGVRLWR
jgi:copper resistance protein B